MTQNLKRINNLSPGDFNTSTLKPVILEDSKFNKKYDVYSEDQIEARYLITPSFMERFKKLKTAFGTNKIKCSFFDNNFMIAISTNENLFELGNLFTPVNFSTAHKFYKQLTSIYLMINYFKLNERTGL